MRKTLREIISLRSLGKSNERQKAVDHPITKCVVAGSAAMSKDRNTEPTKSRRMASGEDGWLKSAEARMRAIPRSKRALVIVVVGVLMVSGLIALDQLYLHKTFADEFGWLSDVTFYQNRTQAVLEGKILYRDLQIEAPPLDIYFMLPAQIAGGSNLDYQLYFSMFTILSALVLYYGLRRFDDYYAFIAALLFLVSPFGTVESTIGIQDKSMIAFFFLLAVVLALQKRDRISSGLSVIGTWTKVFPGLFYPVLFLHTRSWRERGIQLGIIALISLLVAAPFLILAPNEFLKFPLYYLLGSQSAGGGSVPAVSGISVWDYLRTAGLDIPGYVLLGLTVAAYLGALWYGHRKKLGLWTCTALVMVAFLVIYPRIWVGYLILPVALLLIWAAKDKWIAIRLWLMYLPFMGTLLFTSDNPRYVPIINFSGSWAVGLFLTLLGFAILVDTTRCAIRTPSFISGGE